MIEGMDPLYRDLHFLSALSEDRAARLVRFLAEERDGLVVDIGCGWGELLLRTLDAAPRLTGLGIDIDEDFLAEGRRRADQRDLNDRVEFVRADGAAAAPDSVDAIICMGASEVWTGPDDGADYGRALRTMRKRLPHGGRLLYGETIWSHTPQTLGPGGHQPPSHPTLPALLELAVEAGFEPFSVHEATLDEWDTFESGFASGYARWLASHPADHPAAADVRALAERHRQQYYGGYRGVLGMAYLCLLAV